MELLEILFPVSRSPQSTTRSGFSKERTTSRERGVCLHAGVRVNENTGVDAGVGVRGVDAGVVEDVVYIQM